MPHGENLELQRRARAHGYSDGLKDRHQEGQHRQEAYPRTPTSSTAAIRSAFSAGTGLRSTIPAHQLGVGEDMTAHRAIRLCSCRSGSQLELLVKRIQPEIVAMCRPGRWAGTAVACSSKIVTSLPRTGRECVVRLNTCRQSALGWRQIVEHPVDPCPSGRIRIVHNQGKALGTLRRRGPTERGRHIRSVA